MLYLVQTLALEKKKKRRKKRERYRLLRTVISRRRDIEKTCLKLTLEPGEESCASEAKSKSPGPSVTLYWDKSPHEMTSDAFWREERGPNVVQGVVKRFSIQTERRPESSTGKNEEKMVLGYQETAGVQNWSW